MPYVGIVIGCTNDIIDVCVCTSDQEFDHEFVNELGSYIVSIVKGLGMCDLPTIADKVRISGISKVSHLPL